MMRVGNEPPRKWVEGKALLFDDSFEHEVCGITSHKIGTETANAALTAAVHSVTAGVEQHRQASARPDCGPVASDARHEREAARRDQAGGAEAHLSECGQEGRVPAHGDARALMCRVLER